MPLFDYTRTGKLGIQHAVAQEIVGSPSQPEMLHLLCHYIEYLGPVFIVLLEEMTNPQLIILLARQVQLPDKEHGEADTLVGIQVDALPMGTVIPVKDHVGYLPVTVDGGLETVDDELLTEQGNDVLQVVNGHMLIHGKGDLTDEADVLGGEQCIRGILLQLPDGLLRRQPVVHDMPRPNISEDFDFAFCYGLTEPVLREACQVGRGVIEREYIALLHKLRVLGPGKISSVSAKWQMSAGRRHSGGRPSTGNQ